MLGKLIKHEFRATGRILLPVYLVMLLTAALVRGFQVLTEQTAGEFMRALAVLSVLLFSAAVFGGSILAFVLMIYRFYKNLMTDEGYLMFTLPVSRSQLIWSKLIVSMAWGILSAVLAALMWTMVYGKLVPCHRNCEKVWFFNRYGNQTGGCYSLPDRLSGYDRDYKRGKHD